MLKKSPCPCHREHRPLCRLRPVWLLRRTFVNNEHEYNHQGANEKERAKFFLITPRI